MNKIVRYFAYPVVRPWEQARESMSKLRADLDQIKEMRAQRAQREREALQGLTAQEVGQDISSEDLAAPHLIADPKKRFRVMMAAHGRGEDFIKEQLLACKTTRRMALLATAAMTLGCLLTIWFAPLWVAVLTTIVLGFGSAIGLAQAFHYGWWQSQLEDRSLHAPRDYLSKPDFFSHFLKS